MFKQSCTAYKSDFTRICGPFFLAVKVIFVYMCSSKCIKRLLIKRNYCIISPNPERKSSRVAVKAKVCYGSADPGMAQGQKEEGHENHGDSARKYLGAAASSV